MKTFENVEQVGLGLYSTYTHCLNYKIHKKVSNRSMCDSKRFYEDQTFLLFPQHEMYNHITFFITPPFIGI